MKNYIPFILLFFVTSILKSFTVKGQSASSVETATVDTSGGEEVIVCYYPVGIEPEFPGGVGAWKSFLRLNLKYPRAAIKAKVQGTVVVAFIVSPDGKLTEIEVVSGPDELKKAAVDVMKKSPNWEPAVQKGHCVKSYVKQPIIFRLEK